jgi:hypothetical protein
LCVTFILFLFSLDIKSVTQRSFVVDYWNSVTAESSRTSGISALLQNGKYALV